MSNQSNTTAADVCAHVVAPSSELLVAEQHPILHHTLRIAQANYFSLCPLDVATEQVHLENRVRSSCSLEREEG